MFSPRPSFVTILHAGHPAAVQTLDQITLAPEIEAMPRTHPDRVLVEKKCTVARAYLTGDVDGPYIDRDVEIASKILLGELPPLSPPSGRPLTLRDPPA